MSLNERIKQVERHAAVVRCPECRALIRPKAQTLEHPVVRLKRANDRLARLLGEPVDDAPATRQQFPQPEPRRSQTP